MIENMRNNKNRTLEPKKELIVNDVNIKDYNLPAIFTIISVLSLFLLSMRMIVVGV